MLFPHHFAARAWATTQTALRAIAQAAKGIKAFITLLFDESGALEPVWNLSSSLIDTPAFHLSIAGMKTTPEVAAILSERYLASPHDLEALQQYPKDSLGYAYASFMQQAGFEILEPALDASRSAEETAIAEMQYVEYRWRQTHDIWHIITGFDTSEIGEIGLQAFYLAQFGLPLSSMLIANALIVVTLWQPETLNAMLAAIAQGWQMGKTARPLIAQKWEEAWEKPVALWRAELNVQPINA